ncbi:reverse transcriptase domain, reverse transcriptase zinc-binding domain protein [Tanacetum coccineum]
MKSTITSSSRLKNLFWPISSSVSLMSLSSVELLTLRSPVRYSKNSIFVIGNIGVYHPFLVALTWDSIRPRADIVDWYNVVWFSHCVPRHSIHLWLVIQKKLKTQDRLRQWDVGPSVDLNLLKCPLCDLVPDSHDHLFFQCSYSFQVWLKVRVLCGMDSISPQMDDILAFLIPISKGRSVVSIIARVVVAATTYFLWMERNSRLFTKKILSVDKLVQSICSTVRLKLVTFRFKKISPTSRKLLDMWKVPKQCIVHNGSAGPEPNMVRSWVERCDLHVRKAKELRDRKTHIDLRQDLVEHLWNNQ